MDGRWTARVALTAGAAALLVLLVFAGLRSVVLLGLGAAGLAVAAAGVWWVLSRRGPARAFALLLVVLAPLAVLVLYVAAGLFWVVLVALGLWTLALSTGRAALTVGKGRADAPGTAVAPPARPFLIMNPRSGGGKVGAGKLVEKAEALGARVALLDPAQPQDVAALARQAVDDGADLLGVAGGDGTQALVAGVAAEHGVPFMVIPAGTRNHFAMDLGLDRADPASALAALTDGVELRVDLGFIGVAAPEAEGRERVFVNNASFGAYAAVVQSPAYREDKARTTLRMLPDLLTHHAGPRLAVRAQDLTLDAPQAVLVSNNPYGVGDPAGLGRRERLDTGVLGVLGVTVDSAAQAAWMLRGRRGPGLVARTAPEVVVDADTPAVEAGVDGEALLLPTPVRCRIAPGALRVRLPRHRPGVRPTAPPMDWRRVRRLALTRGRAG
ncbi:diacylglycerol/lipid kinase family protein [Streptomyces lydicus]|uniref:diacylglycerol/lipid kinase family protein n=2 Tax=Streptomyces lydicus TaxID=47763 RepID=UPI00331A8EF6